MRSTNFCHPCDSRVLTPCALLAPVPAFVGWAPSGSWDPESLTRELRGSRRDSSLRWIKQATNPCTSFRGAERGCLVPAAPDVIEPLMLLSPPPPLRFRAPSCVTGETTVAAEIYGNRTP